MTKPKLNSTTICLFAIISLAAFFRLVNLSSLPISLFGDEVDVGYHAWSLATTGKDYMGHLLPTYIQSLAEWRAPLLMYLSAPFVGILGPSALSVRLAPALMGILNVYLLYLLTKILTSKTNLALLSAFLLALSPWHIHFSRAAFEVTLLLSLLLGGTILYLKKHFTWSLLLFALTLYTYSTANIITPLLSLLLLYLFPITLPTIVKSSLPAILLALPLVFHFYTGNLSGRFELISIFNDPKIVEEVIINRTEPWVERGTVESIFHNRYTLTLASFGKNYLTSFSPQYLFLSGDPRFRHSPGNFGELLWPTSMLLMAGLYYVLSNFQKKENKLIFFWLLISPIPASLTVQGGNHATRLFIMLPSLIIISAMGGVHLYSIIQNNLSRLRYLLFSVFFLILTFSFASYWHYYANHYRFLSSSQWLYGYDQIFTKLAPIQSHYSKIFINYSKEPSLLMYAFYTRLSPSNFQAMFKGDKLQEEVYPEFNGFLFGNNIYFGKSTTPFVIDHIIGKDGIYLSAQGQEAPGNWDWIKDAPAGTQGIDGVYDLQKNPLFHLLIHKD